MGAGIAESLFESCFSQVLQYTELLKSRSHFRWELIQRRLLFYHGRDTSSVV